MFVLEVLDCASAWGVVDSHLSIWPFRASKEASTEIEIHLTTCLVLHHSPLLPTISFNSAYKLQDAGWLKHKRLGM